MPTVASDFPGILQGLHSMDLAETAADQEQPAAID
jgi:hypothetical protein